MRFASFAIALGFLIFGLASSSVLAATSTASFGVSATVESSCQAAGPATAFGSYPTASRSPVSVTCTVLTPYTVSFSAELTSGNAEKTLNPSKPLKGFVLPSATALVVDRNRMAGTSAAAATGNGSSHARTLFGQPAWAQNVASGAFADAVTITVTY